MKRINEEKTLAILYSDLGGRKKKIHDWIYIAEKCKELTDYYGSYKEVAKKVGCTPELIRSILKLLELPNKVKKLIKERKILYDVGQRIARIKDTKLQTKVGEAVVDLNAHDARALIQYAKRFPNASLKDYKRRLMSSQKKIEKINVVIVPFKEETFKILKQFSEKNKTSPEKLILKIVNRWIKKQK